MDRISIIRLETRTREFIEVARIRCKNRKRRETNMPAAGRSGEGRRLQGRVVTAMTRETSRSRLGQGEAGRKLGGGPIGF